VLVADWQGEDKDCQLGSLAPEWGRPCLYVQQTNPTR
jgi:hypothetical protein